MRHSCQFPGVSNGGRPGRWQREATIWVYIYKGLTQRVDTVGPKCHTGLPRVRQPGHAQDGLGENDLWNSAAHKAEPITM